MMQYSKQLYDKLIQKDKKDKKHAETIIREFLEKHQNVNLAEMELVLLYREDMPRWAFYVVLKEMEEKGEIIREPIYEVTGHIITLLKEEQE